MKHRLGKADLAPGAMRRYPLPSGRDLLVANLGGAYFALDDWCNHAGCSLVAGVLKGTEVTCSCHAMVFDVRTGKLVTEPRLCEDQKRFAVEVEAGELSVELDP